MLATTQCFASILTRCAKISTAASFGGPVIHQTSPSMISLRQCHRSFSVTRAKFRTKKGQPADNNNNTNTSKKNQENNPQQEEHAPDTKRFDVAIVGYPNAGKSQLLNAILGEKVAAVSRKKHTTRDGIMGVATHDKSQLVFCDTPGFMTSPKDKVGRDLMMSAEAGMAGVDYSLVVIDAAKTKLTSDYMNTLSSLMWNALHTPGGKFSIVLNKVDLVKPKTKLLDATQVFGKMADQMILNKIKLAKEQAQDGQPQPEIEFPPEELMPEVFYTCAKQGHNDDGVQDVLDQMLELAVPGRDWLLPEAHQVTPLDLQSRLEEIIREKVYRTLHREVPHQIQQRNRQLELIRGDAPAMLTTDSEDDTSLVSPPSNNSVMMIQQDLLVRSKSHLNLLQKSSGMNLQRIHDSAVPELRRLFQCEVLLTLTAKLISRNQR